jgi:hypothetical protein
MALLSGKKVTTKSLSVTLNLKEIQFGFVQHEFKNKSQPFKFLRGLGPIIFKTGTSRKFDNIMTSMFY